MLQVIRPKQYLDVITGNLIPNPTILIENDRIVQVGYHIPIPRNVQIIELPELTLIPGLIDCHTHITYSYSNGKFGFQDQDKNEIIQGAIENLEKTLLAGFTTIRDVGASNDTDFILRKLIRNGQIIGPQLLVSGEPIFSPNDNVTEKIEKGPNVIKVFNGMKDNQAIFNSQQIRSIVNLASQHNLPVSVHAFEPLSIIESSNGGATTIEHGSFMTKQVAEIMKQNGITLIPTLCMPLHYLNNRDKFNFSPEDWSHFEKAAREGPYAVRLAKSKGVNVCFGTDSIAGAHGYNAKEFLLLNRAGLTPLECIQSATINAAKLLRIYDIGQIDPGFKANLIAVFGNPLDNLELLLPQNINFIMKDGVVIKPHS